MGEDIIELRDSADSEVKIVFHSRRRSQKNNLTEKENLPAGGGHKTWSFHRQWSRPHPQQLRAENLNSESVEFIWLFIYLNQWPFINVD